MANSKTTNQPYEHSIKNLPAWNKILLVLAILSMLTGAGLWAARAIGGDSPQSRSATASGPAGMGTFVEGGGRDKPLSGSGGGQQEPAADDWSPAMFKLGGSFLIAFCVGYALRVFFKMSILAFGIVFLGMFALNHYSQEPIINWSAVSGLMERLAAKIQSEMTGFKTFVEGSLPSAGLAVLGLYSGFRKR